MVSGLDLLREQPKKTGIDLLRQPQEGAKSGLDLLRLAEPTTEAPATEAPSLVWKPPSSRLTGETIQEKMMASYLQPSREEVSWVDEPLHEAAKKAFIDFAKGVGEQALAASELTMNLASSMLLYIPSKLYGAMALPFGREVANMAEEEMASLGYQPLTEEGKKAAEMVGKGFELFLSPAKNLDQIISRLSPELGYLIGFGAELAEFVMTGGIVKGVKAKFKPKPAKAREFQDTKHRMEQETLDQQVIEAEAIPNEVIKRAQQEVIKTEKIQSDLRHKEALEKFDYEPLIAEELARKAEEIARIKQLAPQRPRQWWLDEAAKARKKIVKDEVRGKEALETLLEGEVEMPPKVRRRVKLPEEVERKVADGELTPEEVFELAKEGKLEPKAKPITEVDVQTGTREPLELSTESSPFRELPEHTQTMKKIYEERPNIYREDVEVLTHKLLNDVNRWLDGEKVDITSTRNALSELASRSEELRSEFMESPEYPGNFDSFKAMVSEAADWARKADRMAPVEEFLYQGVVHPSLRSTYATDLPRMAAKMAEEPQAIGAPSPGKTGEGVVRVYRKADVESEFRTVNEYGIPEDAEPVRVITPKEAREVDRLKIEPTEPVRVPFNELTEAQQTVALERAKFVGVKEAEAKKLFYEFNEEGELVRFGKSKPKPTTELYTGVPLDKAAKELISGARKLSTYTRKARGMKTFKPGPAARALKEEFTRTFVDRSGNIRRELLDKLGDVGYEVLQKMYLSKGASSLSANMLKQMRKEVYSGLSRNEKRILDNLILADRMADIGKYKTAKQFKYPEGLTPTDAAAYNELFQYIEKIDAKTAETLKQRAESYFEWMKKPLKDMLDAGLISEEEFGNLISHNYRRIKLVDIFDKRYQAKVGKRKRTVYDSGVEALSRGRETDVYEPSSEIMALEVFNRAYGRILNNKANQNLLGLAKRDPNNPFVRVKEKKGDRIPSGWNRIFVYEEGQRKAIYLSPEMSQEWITTNPEMSYRFSQFVRYSSGAPVLRTFATGINWGFAIANLPRDVMHTWYTARVFEKGKWKPIYNPNLPVFAFQMGRDLATVFTDAALRKGRYEEYIKEGGGMEFLVHQGRLFQRGRHLEGPIDKVYDFMGYFGETSEVMTRLAIRERVMRKGKSSQEGTFAARDYMDFGQGGSFAKALDNGVPYLNAAIQGTRGLMRAFKQNPVSSTYKLSQFAALVTGLYIAMQKMHPQSSKGLRGNIDMQNNLCIPLGDSFGFEDEKGQMHYPYLKIPLDPGQKFFKTFFEAATDKWLGNEVDIDRVVDSLKEQSPVGVTELPPSVSGVLGYITNKDFWLNEDIWRKTEPFGFPKSGEEFIPGVTPEAYIDLLTMEKVEDGKVVRRGLSPERTKYIVEELTTNGTVWSYLLGQGYEAAFGDLPKSKKEQHLAMVLSEIPVIRRFFGVTNPYSQFAQSIDKARQKSDIDRWVQNRGLDMRVEGYLFEKNVERKEVIDYMKSFKDKKVYDRLKDRFEFQEKVKALPNRSFWLRLKGLTVEARARVYVDRLEGATPEELEQLRKELAVVTRAGGVVSKEFRKEVSRLRE